MPAGGQGLQAAAGYAMKGLNISLLAAAAEVLALTPHRKVEPIEARFAQPRGRGRDRDRQPRGFNGHRAAGSKLQRKAAEGKL